MGPADTDTDIFCQPIFLPIPIPIYLHQHIGHRYRYRYSQFTDIWPISGILADILADIHVFSPISCRYRYNRYPDQPIPMPIPIWPIPISSLPIPIYRYRYRYRPNISANRYIGLTLILAIVHGISLVDKILPGLLGHKTSTNMCRRLRRRMSLGKCFSANLCVLICVNISV